MFEHWIAAVFTIFEPYHLLTIVAGTVIGISAGAIPGVSGTMAIALAIPVTYVMGPATALFFLVSLYGASVFGGSISAILFRTPGAPEAAATTIDGYEMTKQGRGGEALGISIFSSAIGGLFGTVVLALIAPQLAKVALEFGPPEFFALAFLGLSVVSSLDVKNTLKALVAVLIGLLIATVGIDKITGLPRFTFGSNTLMGGVTFVPTIVGLFAVTEVLKRMKEKGNEDGVVLKTRAQLPSFRLINSIKGLLLRSAFIGTFIGILPGIGATTSSFVSYGEAVRWSKKPESFGSGIPEGIAAPEAANNAACGGAMVPLLTLGIPGSAATALMLGALMIQGLKPGPLLFIQQPVLLYSVFGAMFLANVLIIITAKVFVRYFSKIIQLPYNYLGPGIIIFCVGGVFAVRNSFGDIWIMIIFALLGYFMEKYNYPLPPLILGIILGPIAEENLRQAMIISGNDPMVLISTPLSAVLIILAILSLFSIQIKALFRNFRKKTVSLSSES